jgi:hypothetical protein
MRTKVAVAGKFQGQLDVLGVVALVVFHDSGGFGGVWFDTLAL